MARKKKYTPTKFMAKTSHYDKNKADYAVNFIELLCHTKGTWAGKKFKLLPWQEQIIRDRKEERKERIGCSCCIVSSLR